MFPRKRHQMRHLCDLACLFAKQVLSQLSYTPILVYSKRLVSLWYIIAYAGSI
jgi:hypothetical protein